MNQFSIKFEMHIEFLKRKSKYQENNNLFKFLNLKICVYIYNLNYFNFLLD